jgi:hypothetical protein
MQTQILTRWLWVLLLTVIFPITACDTTETTATVTASPPAAATAIVTESAPTPTTIPATTEQPPQGQAFLESLQVMVLESFPVQVQAMVGGNLSDSCTTVAESSAQRQDNTFIITIVTSYDTQGACTQALAPFSEMISLDVQGLPAGDYTVTAGSLSETFTLAVDNVPAAAPDMGGAMLTLSTNSAHPGDRVTLTGSGFPAGAMVGIGFGPVNSEYDIITSTQAGADGRFTTEVAVPTQAGPGELVFVAEVNNATVLTTPLSILESDGNVGVPVEGVNVPVNGLFSRTYIYLIALEDGGQGGPLVGCNDSAIPVVIDIEPTVAPLTAAINRLLHIDEQYYGESGLYNALYQSDLALAGINITNRQAVISLTGNLQLGGACDDPRVLAQLEQTALQYSTVDTVSIVLNGQPWPSQSGG